MRRKALVVAVERGGTPPKWTRAQEDQARSYYQLQGRDPACAPLGQTTLPTASTSSSAPSGAWTPELDDSAWGQFSGAGASVTQADRRCVLDVIEAHWPDPATLANATQSDSEIVGREIAIRCGRG